MADPGNAEWQRDLSIKHDRIGNVLQAQGDLPAALASYHAALAIAERLARADPVTPNGNVTCRSAMVRSVMYYRPKGTC